MVRISEQQIDFILNDISARGVMLESLQLHLLDHICCILEQELQEGDDFYQHYPTVIARFYEHQLSEIEEETNLLLNNKYYYFMKKLMIMSGAFSAIVVSLGIFFKYLHWPGASIMLTVGIGLSSLVFLPLLVTLKIKEQQKAKDKLLIFIGSLSAIMLSLAILFKVMHWPGANIMGVLAPALLLLVFMPINYITGVRQPENRINTMVTSMLIIIGCALFFSLTITPQNFKRIALRNTNTYLRSQQILQHQEALLANDTAQGSPELQALTADIKKHCESLKQEMLLITTDNTQGPTMVIEDCTIHDFQSNYPAYPQVVDTLAKLISKYNNEVAKSPQMHPIAIKYSVVDIAEPKPLDKVLNALNDLTQIEMQLLQNQLVKQHSMATAFTSNQ